MNIKTTEDINMQDIPARITNIIPFPGADTIICEFESEVRTYVHFRQQSFWQIEFYIGLCQKGVDLNFVRVGNDIVFTKCKTDVTVYPEVKLIAKNNLKHYCFVQSLFEGRAGTIYLAKNNNFQFNEIGNLIKP